MILNLLSYDLLYPSITASKSGHLLIRGSGGATIREIVMKRRVGIDEKEIFVYPQVQ